ncbi:hypothetical protein [Mangrovicoccus ximenensis]|uniref:hypothetical protein n=1 Tax=Mangrovicoccus ximenensis TaxID=1911570 RepID=UPI0011AE94D2|nr:hypothetical protein [Mangrovicoccus ximenensis]
MGHQAQRLAEHRLHSGQAAQRDMRHVLVAGHDQPLALRAEQQQRLFEARVEAGEEGDVGGMFAVGIDGGPGTARAGVQRIAARGIDFGRDLRLRVGQRDLRQGDGPEAGFGGDVFHGCLAGRKPMSEGRSAQVSGPGAGRAAAPEGSMATICWPSALRQRASGEAPGAMTCRRRTVASSMPASTLRSGVRGKRLRARRNWKMRADGQIGGASFCCRS